MESRFSNINLERRYVRLPVREVLVGEIGVGGNNPIRVQSMVNTDPDDLAGTTDQIIELATAGCEIVRIAIPTLKAALNLKIICDGLKKRDITVPIVADVHFNPEIAEICAKYVDKVRINPGNYGIFGKTNIVADNEESYTSALEQTEKHIKKLIEVCRNYDTAIRIGSNHGSLSRRILHRYGDTPEGMVESALEFVRIFRKYNFHNLIISLKSSNVKVMVNAYRLLVKKMIEEEFNYPLHLGVTEAGTGKEGVVRSAAGIGPLLEEGIGDTIRVSLTGNPLDEIPFAKILCNRYNPLINEKNGKGNYKLRSFKSTAVNKDLRKEICGIGGSNPPVIIGGQTNSGNNQPDIIIDSKNISIERNSEKKPAQVYAPDNNKHFKVISFDQFERCTEIYSNEAVMILLPEDADQRAVQFLKKTKQSVLIITASINSISYKISRWIDILEANNILLPRVLRITAGGVKEDEMVLNSTALAAGSFVDMHFDGLWIISELAPETINYLSFQILQATRVRITNTEYISCPTCGRTKFDVQQRLLEIKKKTSHLPGLKIAVMGCVVNGPGEMADADYGYVGRADKSINLYKRSKIVKKGVPEEFAVEALIECIKKNGDWQDP